jgi:hypothetical protein
MKEEDR